MTHPTCRDILIVGVRDIIIARSIVESMAEARGRDGMRLPQVPRAFTALKRLRDRFAGNVILIDDSKPPLCEEHRDWLRRSGFEEETRISLKRAMFVHLRTDSRLCMKPLAAHVCALPGIVAIVHNSFDVLKRFASAPRPKVFFMRHGAPVQEQELMGLPASAKAVATWREVEESLM